MEKNNVGSVGHLRGKQYGNEAKSRTFFLGEKTLIQQRYEIHKRRWGKNERERPLFYYFPSSISVFALTRIVTFLPETTTPSLHLFFFLPRFHPAAALKSDNGPPYSTFLRGQKHERRGETYLVSLVVESPNELHTTVCNAAVSTAYSSTVPWLPPWLLLITLSVAARVCA